MNHRERFVRLFQGKTVDRAPFIDAMGVCNYNSCIDRWKTEGLDINADRKDVQDIVGFDYARGYFIYAKLLFYPEFEISLIKRDGDKTYVRNHWGGVELRKDNSELMPITIEGPVKDRYTWEAVKERLIGNVSERLPKNFADVCKEAQLSDLPVYTGDLPAGFFGALREIMGFENLMYLFYDDPDLLCEILDTLCDLWVNVYSEIQKHVALDYVFIWEDMCNKTGPLISPPLFREFLLSRYKRLTNTLRSNKNNTPLFFVDSDGDERPLVPLWLEGGVDIVFPWETQFGLDIIKVRQDYPTMGMMGGLNKHILEFTREEMDKELEKVPYMLEQGYYIPCLDHGVTNAVSWDNYRYFYARLKELIYKYPPKIQI
ncbi:MAG: hypothetical protein FWD71_11260 [Oscillospiraceae bacterium]|nr:hypothetical protein [Oscillospiraceae bacterium]